MDAVADNVDAADPAERPGIQTRDSSRCTADAAAAAAVDAAAADDDLQESASCWSEQIATSS